MFQRNHCEQLTPESDECYFTEKKEWRGHTETRSQTWDYSARNEDWEIRSPEKHDPAQRQECTTQNQTKLEAKFIRDESTWQDSNHHGNRHYTHWKYENVEMDIKLFGNDQFKTVGINGKYQVYKINQSKFLIKNW